MEILDIILLLLLLLLLLVVVRLGGMGSKSLRTFREQTENDFKDPEDGFWDKTTRKVS